MTNPPQAHTPLVHGGHVQQATALFGQPAQGWLDLSTGINPYAYPLPNIASSAWQCLPYLDDSVHQAACDYYWSSHGHLASAGTQQVLLTAGSQTVIEKLPYILAELSSSSNHSLHHGSHSNKVTLLPDVGYQEHRHAWENYGNVITYDALQANTCAITDAIEQGRVSHLVLINPNNPTGTCYPPAQIRSWAQQLAALSGFVVVDEAFMDATPELSVLRHASNTQALPHNVVVLRSFGKFFGLAGIRMGAVVASASVLAALASQLGTWDINGPAQAVAKAAWQDTPWQHAMQGRLLAEQPQQLALWHTTMLSLGAKLQTNTALFSSFCLPHDMAYQCYSQAAQQGILLRLITLHNHLGDNQHSLIRIGNVDLHNAQHINRCQQFCQYVINHNQ